MLKPFRGNVRHRFLTAKYVDECSISCLFLAEFIIAQFGQIGSGNNYNQRSDADRPMEWSHAADRVKRRMSPLDFG